MPDRVVWAFTEGTSRHAQLGLECTEGLKETQTEGSSEMRATIRKWSGKAVLCPTWMVTTLLALCTSASVLALPEMPSPPLPASLRPFGEVSFFLAEPILHPRGSVPVCSCLFPLTCVYLCRLDAYHGDQQDAATCLETQQCCKQEAEPSPAPRLGHVGSTGEGCHAFPAHVLGTWRKIFRKD